ncbi:glutathionylspermidine synthase family protein [Xanthomonas sacchari]|uniref:glutathionylspermidine synthase family protein n=1 Tax=Xanthomonas sacchari TaxID=56458 RepID=UPI002257DC6F|nr:glutathionylspermidine synthase family protein [Xanthomonas sacchari]MCW0413009.1 putative acid--amine ligase YgiC [Xanthomonas sacchari]UYK66995.1 glutathionylspermidine synthase family protein [Xanthomonas sacchari]UYK81107.1 glutathionylspermidine synthase family protein [Xanthomonas sacchari]
MKRIAIVERGDWRAQAAEYGFRFHTIDGQRYWDERAYYAFNLRQIERDLEDPSAELHAMAMGLLDEIVASEALMQRLAIPPAFRDWIADSWRRREPHLYGRLDLAYDGRGPAKLYELNYDTPTSLFESAFFQWQWLEDQRAQGRLPDDADQFNSIHEALLERFAALAGGLPPPLYFAAVRDSEEDQGTIAYLRDCAAQAGVGGELIAIEDIGLSSDGRYTDLDDTVIGALFKLYPLEDMFAERFGQALPGSGLRLLEPPWKALLSNKGILPLLWERHRGHPNLLPAAFDDGSALPPGWVRKPLHSREGANIVLHLDDGRVLESDGPYAGPYIRQQAHPLPAFEGRYPMVGSWIVGDRACGIGIREDDGPITRDSARFLPHAIVEDARPGVLYA